MATQQSEYYKETYTVRETTETSTGVMDRQYYCGIPGILKIVEIVTCLIAYICVQATLRCIPVATFDFFRFVAIFCFVTVSILYFILLFRLQVRILRCDCARDKWPVFELGYYIGVIIFLFFGDLFLSLHGCLAGHKAGVFFGWVAFAAFVIDLVLVIAAFVRGRNSATTQTTVTTTSTGAQDSRY